jgi:hypothetical protein
MKRTPTLEQFARLREHLSALNPIFERFCREYGYVERTTALGRYPRRYIRRSTEVNLFFDLQMDLDDEGEYFQQFDPSLPYSMGAGAGMDIGLERHSIIFMCFQKLPFFDVEKKLWNFLIEGHSKMSGWNKDYLLKEGKKSPIAKAD